MRKVVEKLVFLTANGLAAVMDFGVGALIAVSLSALYGTDVTVYTFLLGGLLALLPDFDVVPSIFSLRYVRFDHHATLFHRPFFMLVVVGVIAGLFGGILWLLIALACLLYHYLHDTAWAVDNHTSGISWLWPVTNKCLTWWGLYDRTAPKNTHKVWLEELWLQPSRKSVLEVSVGLAAFLTALSIDGVYPILLVLFPPLVVCGMIFVWSIPRLFPKVVK